MDFIIIPFCLFVLHQVTTGGKAWVITRREKCSLVALFFDVVLLYYHFVSDGNKFYDDSGSAFEGLEESGVMRTEVKFFFRLILGSARLWWSL